MIRFNFIKGVFLAILLLLSFTLANGQRDNTKPQNTSKEKTYKLESAGIQIKVSESLTVGETSDSLTILNENDGWGIEITDVGNGKSAGEITVNKYFSKMRPFSNGGRGNGKLSNGMIFARNNGSGNWNGKDPIKWSTLLVAVSENQYVLIWIIFKNGAAADRNKVLSCEKVVQSIEKFE